MASKLQTVQIESISSAVDIAQAERQLKIDGRKAAVRVASAETLAAAEEAVTSHKKKELAALLEIALLQIKDEAAVEQERTAEANKHQEGLNALDAAERNRRKLEDDFVFENQKRVVELEFESLLKETEELVKRASAVTPQMQQALQLFGDKALVREMTTTLAPMAAMSGISVVEIMSKMLAGTPFEGVLSALGDRTKMPIANKLEA